MALKSASPSNSHPFLHLAKRFYRAVGWIGVCITLILSTVGAVDIFGRLSPETVLTYRLLGGFLAFLAFVFSGLFLSGLAFLISACIDAACNVMENGRTQTELLRRLVREQSDIDAASHLMDYERPQTQIPHRPGHEQSDVQSR